MKFKSISFALLLSLLAAFPGSAIADQAIIKIKGLPASVGAPADGAMPLISYAYEAEMPTAPTGGQASGRLIQHITLFRNIDSLSPFLMSSALTNKPLGDVEIVLNRTNANGEDAPFLSMKLTNAMVVTYKHVPSGTSPAGPAAKRSTGTELETEETTLTFQSIVCQTLGGRTTSTSTLSSTTIRNIKP